MEERKEELKDRLNKALEINDKKAVDLVTNLKIPKSAVSQYLSGKSKNMTSERIYAIAKYLNVSEAWLLGYDVPMERNDDQKNSDELVELINRLRKDKGFRSLVNDISKLNPLQLEAIKNVVAAFPVE